MILLICIAIWIWRRLHPAPIPYEEFEAMDFAEWELQMEADQ